MSGVRWSIAAVVLMIAAVVALWPRDNDDPAPQPAGERSPDLTAAREAAALPPCPTSDTPVTSGLTALSGVRAECLADGRTAPVTQALAGRPALVNMWATWCTPCKKELPVLAEYAAEPGAVDVVTLAVESSPADALEFLAALKIRLPSLSDEPGAARRALHPSGLPASYLVGSDGSVRLVGDPRVFESVEDVRHAVAGLT